MSKTLHSNFAEIKTLISSTRQKALAAVNEQLVVLYWNVGKYISAKIQKAEWGEKVLPQLASYLKTEEPELKGFSSRNIQRMRLFYETYCQSQIVTTVSSQLQKPEKPIVPTLSAQIQKSENKIVVSPTPQFQNIENTLITKISWSHHVEILNKAKALEEREYYILLAIKEKLSVRELRRQMESGYFERTMLTNKNLPLVQEKVPQNLSSVFKDSYIFEFLNLPEPHSENDLQKGLIANLKKFLLELGDGFTFVGENVRLQVGMKDFYTDLLFFHRDLQCLVVFELKITDFEPSFLGQLDFYLEALDRDHRRPHENPTIGVLLCKQKDIEVVEYAMNRNMSPALVAEYNTKFIDKKILEQKFAELLSALEADK